MTRRGGTINALLVALAILGALSAAAVVVGPRYILAGPGGTGPDAGPAVHPAHQALIDELASLIRRGVGVLGVHHRDSSPYEEIVLWLNDEADSTLGRPDEREVAVVSHSRIMRTITIYRIAARGGPPRRAVAALGTLEFCEALRADPRAAALVVASGVTDMRAETIGEPEPEWAVQGELRGRQALRLTLTWAPDSADGPGEASVLVDTVVFASGDGSL